MLRLIQMLLLGCVLLAGAMMRFLAQAQEYRGIALLCCMPLLCFLLYLPLVVRNYTTTTSMGSLARVGLIILTVKKFEDDAADADDLRESRRASLTILLSKQKADAGGRRESSVRDQTEATTTPAVEGGVSDTKVDDSRHERNHERLLQADLLEGASKKPPTPRRKSLRLAVARLFAGAVAAEHQHRPTSGSDDSGRFRATTRLNKLSRIIPQTHQQAEAVIKAAKQSASQGTNA